jgi:hypothetical protein
VADDRYAIAIDVTPVGQPPHDGECILGLIAKRRRFGASAACTSGHTANRST